MRDFGAWNAEDLKQTAKVPSALFKGEIETSSGQVIPIFFDDIVRLRCFQKI